MQPSAAWHSDCAVPDESPVQKPEDLQNAIIATELVNVTRRYFASRGVKVNVEFSWGTTEIKARLLDAIVDCTETDVTEPEAEKE